MRPRVLIAEPLDFSPVALSRLQESTDVELRATRADELSAAFAAYDVVWMRLAQRIDADTLGSAPRAKVLAVPVTGIDHIDVDACRRAGIRVVSLKGEVEFLRTVRATAELTLGLMLALLRHIPAARDDVRGGQWRRDLFRGGELFQKTVGIVGMGRLGTIVADLLRAFGAHVIGFDPRTDFPTHAVDARAATLQALLAASDIVTLHVSYQPETHHLIHSGAFAAMKPGALLVNTSRGGVVDETALLAALDNGKLSGAALDVLQGEPHITGDHPLVKAARLRDNLLVVPHIGGNTRESFEKTELFLAGRVLEALGMGAAP